MTVDEDCCFICLGCEEPLIRPCRCLTCHQTCLARWQLQSAGKQEERQCRFCKQALPSWKAAFSDVSGEAAAAMSIQFNGHTYWLQVKPGECGVEQFKEDVRRLLGLTAEQAFDITFECRAPDADESKMELEGLAAYDAAVYCASHSAARRAGSKGNDSRRRSTGSGSAISSSSSMWARSRSVSDSSGDVSSSRTSNGGSSSDDGRGSTGRRSSSGSGSEDEFGDHATVHDLAHRSWLAGGHSSSVSSSTAGKLCLLQTAAAHLLSSLRLLWQAPDDIDAFD